MNNKEIFYKNLEQEKAFTDYAMEHPNILDFIPEGARLVFLPEDDPKLCRANLKLLKMHQSENRSVVYVRMVKVPQLKQVEVAVPQLQIAPQPLPTYT